MKSYLLFQRYVMESNGTLSVNKKLFKDLGIKETIFLTELCDEHDYHESTNQLIDGKWFFSTVEDIKNEIGLTKTEQLTIIKKLIEYELIEKKLIGVPPKRCFAINFEKLIEILNN